MSSTTVKPKPIIEKWLSVFDKTKEKDGKNKAIYHMGTYLEQNFLWIDDFQHRLQRVLDKIEGGRFWVATGFNLPNIDELWEALDKQEAHVQGGS